MARKLPPGISKRGDKFTAMGYDPQKRANSRIGTFDTREQAVDAKELFERTKHRARSRQRWTCDEFAAEWLNLYSSGRADSTIRHYKERVQQFGRDFKGIPLGDLDRPTARRWAMKNPDRVSAVRAMYSDALNDGIVDVNPFLGLRVGSSSKGRKDISALEDHEVQTLIRTARQIEPDFPMLGHYITVAAYTGMRLGELHGLQWDDIDWQAGTIHVERQWRSKDSQYAPPKNGEARTIRMGPQAEEALRAIHSLGELAPEGLVFCTKRFKRFDQRVHFYYWNPVRKAFWTMLPRPRQFVPGEDIEPVGRRIPPDFDFHELRHFTGSWLASLDVTLPDGRTRRLTAREIAYQLGHTDGGLLAQRLYIHTDEQDALEAIGWAMATPARVRQAS